MTSHFLSLFLISILFASELFAEVDRIEINNPDAEVFYAACLNDKVYVIGEPYELAFRIRDVLDQNFAELAYTGGELGYYFRTMLRPEKDKAGKHQSMYVDFKPKRTARAREEMNFMKSVQIQTAPDRPRQTVFDYLMGESETAQRDRKHWALYKLGLDKNKVKAFFERNRGKGDFNYRPEFLFGSIKVSLEPNPVGGIPTDKLLTHDSRFVLMVKQAMNRRQAAIVFFVAPDGEAIYQKANAIAARQKLMVRKKVWDGKRIKDWSPNKKLEYSVYDMAALREDEYLKVAKSVGPKLTTNVNAMMDRFEQDLKAISIPENLSDRDAIKYREALREERTKWARMMAFNACGLYRCPLTASEANKEEKVAITSHPPFIPHIGVFYSSPAPTKPKQQ